MLKTKVPVPVLVKPPDPVPLLIVLPIVNVEFVSTLNVPPGEFSVRFRVLSNAKVLVVSSVPPLKFNAPPLTPRLLSALMATVPLLMVVPPA